MFVQKPEWTLWLTQCYSNISLHQVINFYFSQSVWTVVEESPQISVHPSNLALLALSWCWFTGGWLGVRWGRECLPQWCIVLGEEECHGQYHKPWHPFLQRPGSAPPGVFPLNSAPWFWKGSRVTLDDLFPLLQIATSCISCNDSLGHLSFHLIFLFIFHFSNCMHTSQLNFSLSCYDFLFLESSSWAILPFFPFILWGFLK